jgi:DNA-binding transcriptional ArsR family regulator
MAALGDDRRGAGLPIDAELRVALGVELDERLVLVSHSARALVVGRERPGDAPLPVDRDLALSADVRAFPLPDVFSWIHGASKSGLLLFANDEHAKRVWMHRGEVVFAASNQRIDRLGHSLVRAGVLALDQLRDAERGYRRGERFGKTLVERGLLTPRELWAGLQRQVEEIVRSLFSYPSGSVFFWDGELQPDNVVRLELPTQRLVQEGMRWRDELRRFVAALSDPRVRIEAVAAQRDGTSGTERLLVDALGEETAFGSLCRRVGLDEPTVARTLQLLHRGGVVRIRRTADDPDMTQRVRRADPAEAVRERVRRAAQAIEELVAPIVAVEGAEPLRERFRGALEEVAARYPGVLDGVQPSAAATLEAEVLLERASALTPERSRELGEALGALLDYLEFELKNHPGVRGGDEALQAVAPLRATFRD